MLLIHYPSCFKALDYFIDSYNALHSRRQERLQTGDVLTAKEIIRIYGLALLKANSCQPLQMEHLPSLQTNNKQLARLVKCSARTIQRHIVKLKLAGFITRKIFHGSNANYELLINPKLLLTKQSVDVHKGKTELKEAWRKVGQLSASEAVLSSEKTKCPHTYCSNIGNTINNVVIGVNNPDKSAAGAFTVGNTDGNIDGNTGEIACEKIGNKKTGAAPGPEKTGEIASRVEPSEVRNERSDTTRDNSLNLYVSLFWLTARNLLYPDTVLTANQIQIAKKYIRRFYDCVDESKWPSFHNIYIARLILAAKYIQKDPQKRYVQLPYLYFNPDNPHGFRGTKSWYYAELKRKKELEHELILNRLIRRYQSNERKSAENKQPALSLFRQSENTLGKLNDPGLLDRFHAAVLNHETYRYLNFNA